MVIEVIVPGKIHASKCNNDKWGHITPDGIFFLNKKSPGYNILAGALKSVCAIGTTKLKIKRWILLHRTSNDYPTEVLKTVIDLELIRRKVKKARRL